MCLPLLSLWGNHPHLFYLMSETPAVAGSERQPQIIQSELKTSYANVCRIAQTPNEVLIDFGLNPNFYGTILDEPLKLENRIVMSHDAAKRLCIHLTSTIQNFEAKYGTIELDVAKRMVRRPDQPAIS